MAPIYRKAHTSVTNQQEIWQAKGNNYPQLFLWYWTIDIDICNHLQQAGMSHPFIHWWNCKNKSPFRKGRVMFASPYYCLTLPPNAPPTLLQDAVTMLWSSPNICGIAKIIEYNRIDCCSRAKRWCRITMTENQWVVRSTLAVYVPYGHAKWES